MGTHPIFESDFDCLTGELCWSSYQIKFWDDADFPGADFAYLWAETQENCMDWCLADLECQGLYKKSNEFLLK